MNKFPTITIPDPAAVGKWLADQLGDEHGGHWPSFSTRNGWHCLHWFCGSEYVTASGDTPEALLADIRRQLAENDPLAKLRKEAEAAGYELTPKAP